MESGEDRPTDPVLAGSTCSGHPRGADLRRRADQAGLSAIADVDAGAVPELVHELDAAVLLGIAAFLGSSTSLRNGSTHSATEVAEELGTAPRHRWIPGHWLASLAEEGLVTRDADGRFRDLRRIRRAELAAAREAIDRSRRGLGYPRVLTQYLLGTLRHLLPLLRDEVSAQALLFPDADLATAEAAYRDNVINRYLNAAATEVTRWVLGQHPETLRVLELGAGIGATTSDLLPVLSGHPVDYLFTDLSRFFLEAAKARFAEYRFLRYRLLDFNTGIRAQLPDIDQVDLVVAANTAHNALHVGELLAQVRGLLAPPGALLLIETTHEHHQSLTSMPFLLSSRADQPPPERRDTRVGTCRTYLTGTEWREQLRLAGLDLVVELPDPGQPLAAFSQHLLLATA